MDFDALLKEASRYESQLRAHRRALHHIPELGYEEHETHAYLMKHLRALAPDDLKTFARTGIRAVFHGTRDCLPLGYRRTAHSGGDGARLCFVPFRQDARLWP